MTENKNQNQAGKHTVLIIEDEMDMRFFLKTLVETNGFVALTARNGKEGLKILSQSKPDVILLDVMMPEIGGAKVYHELKSNQATQGIPVIILSGVHQRTFLHYLKMLGVQMQTTIPNPAAYIEKPPDPKDVLEMIHKCMADGEHES